MELLFAKRIKKEIYKFYKTQENGGVKYSVVVPKSAFGYEDNILFTSSQIPYTLHKPCPKWVLVACKKALIQKGYF